MQKLGDPRPLHLQQPTQVSGRHPGPVGEQVEAALLRRFEQRRQQVVGCGVVLPVHVEVFGEGDPLGRLLGRQLSVGSGVLQGPTEVEGYRARGYAPYGRGWVCRHSVPLKGEERSGRRSCQQPPRLSEAHLVGKQDKDGAGRRAVPQSPHPLGEGRPVGGEPLPDDADDAFIGKDDGGVHGLGPVPAEADGVGDVGDSGSEPVDDCGGIQPLQQDALPPGGDGIEVQKLIHRHALDPCQPVQPRWGEIEAARWRRDVRGVGDGGGEALGLQPVQTLVDRAPRPAGDGDQLQPVEEGHGCQMSQ